MTQFDVNTGTVEATDHSVGDFTDLRTPGVPDLNTKTIFGVEIPTKFWQPLLAVMQIMRLTSSMGAATDDPIELTAAFQEGLNVPGQEIVVDPSDPWSPPDLENL